MLALQALFPWTERYGTYTEIWGQMKREGNRSAKGLRWPLQGVQPYLTNERNLGWTGALGCVVRSKQTTQYSAPERFSLKKACRSVSLKNKQTNK